MHTVDFGGKQSVKFASCIEEMSQAEFEYFIKLLLQQQSGSISIDDFRRLLTIKLLNIRKTVAYYKMSRELQQIIHDHIRMITDTLDSFYEYEELDGKLIHSLQLNWIVQKLPKIGNLYGPADALTNCTFFEYKEAFAQYLLYTKYRDNDHMNRLIAILYRPRPMAYRLRNLIGSNQVPDREPFTSNTSDQKLYNRMIIVRRWPDHIKTAILLWFGNCVEYLRTGKPVVDGTEIDFSILYPKSNDENTGPSGIGLTGIAYSLAESGVFGDVNKTANQNLYDILIRLYQLQLEYNAMKAKSKQNDKN